MTIINVTMPFGLIKDVNDYSKIINEILTHEISFNILKFSTSSTGITLLLDIPEDKIKTITEALEKNKVIVNKKGRIKVDEDKCINCGACISVCPTDALHFDEQEKLEFVMERCIGCLICLDSCPRHAIEENI
jgi:formate hydrogenlyase subunit 6/NADH:ubiquinone oxidoreductase subunit I